MKKIVEFIQGAGVGYVATVEGKQPRVRPFGFGYYEDGKFWFCTNNTKKVFKQIKENPYIEVMFTKPDFSQYLRLSGHITIDPSLEAKTKVMDAMPAVKGIYKSPDNPIFEVFCIDSGEAVLESFPVPTPPYVVKF